MAINKKVQERIVAQLKRFQPILADAKNRDISESDTVVIIGDMLAEVLGYRKYSEITTEFAIRGSYVDLAVKVDQEIRFLIEAKAIGVDLKDAHIKQAIDYGANQGIEWVVLTNGVVWKIFKIHFKQPIDKSLVFEVDLLASTPRSASVIECFGNLSREAFAKSSMTAFFLQQQATSRFSLAALVLTDAVLGAMKRELRRLMPMVKVEEEFLRAALVNEVLKREVVDGEEAKIATEALRRAERATLKAKQKTAEAKADEPAEPQPESEPENIATSPAPGPVETP